MWSMTKSVSTKQFKSGIRTIGRNYSVLSRAIIRDNVQRKRKLLVAAVTCVGYQQVLKVSRARGREQKNYYDILELSPKSTQAQVKNAYYNLSKTYHPDQYKGTEDASHKFREITEAYEVLGNFHKRKMYDRGMLHMSVAATPAEAEEYSTKFYESRKKRSQAPTATGRTPIYNFDEWSKLHYTSSRERREDAKMRYEEIQKLKLHEEEEKKTESVVLLILLGVIFYLMSVTKHPDVDSPKRKDK